MDASRRHEILGLEKKDFVSHSSTSHEFSVHIGLLALKCDGAMQSGPGGYCAGSMFVSQLRDPRVGNL